MVLSEPLLQLGSFSVYPFGIFLAAIFVLGTFLFWRAATRAGFAPAMVFDLTFLSSLVALIVGRIVFLLSVGDPPVKDLLTFGGAVLRIGEGIFWAPAFLAGLGAFYLYTRRRKEWSFFKIVDLAMPVLALGQGLVLLAAEATTYLVSALYTGIGYLGLFAILELIQKKITMGGVVFWAYLLISGALTVFFEIQRPAKALAFGTDLNFLFAFILLVAGGSGLIYLFLRSRGILDLVRERISISPFLGKVEKQLRFKLKEGQRLIRLIRFRQAKKNGSKEELSSNRTS